MAIVGFKQDPSGPLGAGLFEGDDGREVYAHMPDVAAQFAGAMGPRHDARLAMNDAGAGANMSLADGGMSPAPPKPPMMSDAGASMQPQNRDPSQFLPVGGAPNATPVAAPPPGEMGPPSPPPMPPPPGEAQREGIANLLQGIANTPGGGARPAGWRPKGQSVTIEAGAPYSETQANDRALAESDVQRAHLAGISAFANQQEANAAAMGVQREKVETELQEAKGKQAAKQQMYDDERARVQGLIDATASQKIDPGRWFNENKFGGIMAIIGQAMGAWAATKGHTENFAQRIVDNTIDNDIAAQRTDIEQGRAKYGNALQMLHLQMGDMDQATAALKMIQEKAVNLEIARQGAMSQSTDAKAKAGEWVAQRNQDFVKSEQGFQNAALGKVTTKTDQAYQEATSGTVDPLARLKRMGEAGKILSGDLGADPAAIASAVGLPAKGNKETEALTVPNGQGGTIQARTEVEARELRKNHALLTNAVSASNTMAEIAKGDTAGSTRFNPEAKRKYAIAREVLMNSVNTLSGQGVVRNDDVERWKDALSGDAWSFGAEAAAQEIQGRVKGMYAAQVDSQLSPGATTPTIQPKSAKEYGK